MRGNPWCRAPGSRRKRSIPACAGEPAFAKGSSGHSRVYPRVCGGTSRLKTGEIHTSGLSPRVRGNRRVHVCDPLNRRSIPACAGEPSLCPRPSLFSWVYPRVCGGTALATPDNLGYEGLSPRVRGNPPRERRPGPRHGSIPACAGEPLVNLRSLGQHPVYPRVCGGTCRFCPWIENTQGLSPRVRGNLAEIYDLRYRIWSIPACAGEPRPQCLSVPVPTVYPRVCGGTISCGSQGLS